MFGVTLGESIQAWIIVIAITIGLSISAGALAYVVLKPIVGWVLEPLEKNLKSSFYVTGNPEIRDWYIFTCWGVFLLGWGCSGWGSLTVEVKD